MKQMNYNIINLINLTLVDIICYDFFFFLLEFQDYNISLLVILNHLILF